jgi:hypothetical protein
MTENQPEAVVIDIKTRRPIVKRVLVATGIISAGALVVLNYRAKQILDVIDDNPEMLQD